MAVDLEILLEDLKRDEGLRLFPYLDTVGKWTIGFGRNLSDRGISTEEASFLLNNDMADTSREMEARFISMDLTGLNEPIQRALVNMAFNMGVPRLMKFIKMWDALQRGHYATAADEALDSKWAQQVGPRANRIAALIRDE